MIHISGSSIVDLKPISSNRSASKSINAAQDYLIPYSVFYIIITPPSSDTNSKPAHFQQISWHRAVRCAYSMYIINSLILLNGAIINHILTKFCDTTDKYVVYDSGLVFFPYPTSLYFLQQFSLSLISNMKSFVISWYSIRLFGSP